MHKLVCCNVTQPIDKLRQARTDSCTLSSTFTALPHKRAHDSTCCRRRTRRMPRSPAVAPLPQSTHRSRQVAWQPLPPPSDTHSLPPAAVAGGFGAQTCAFALRAECVSAVFAEHDADMQFVFLAFEKGEESVGRLSAEGVESRQQKNEESEDSHPRLTWITETDT